MTTAVRPGGTSSARPQPSGLALPGLVGDLEQGGAQRKTKGALQGAGETLKEIVSDVSDKRQASRRGDRGGD